MMQLDIFAVQCTLLDVRPTVTVRFIAGEWCYRGRDGNLKAFDYSCDAHDAARREYPDATICVLVEAP